MKQMIWIAGIIAIMNTHNADAQAFSKSTAAVTSAENTRIVNLYPNPARTVTTVVLSYIPREKIMVDIIDYNGQIRRSYEFPPGENRFNLDIGFLENGNFVLYVRQQAVIIDVVKIVKA